MASDPTEPGIDLLREAFPEWTINLAWISRASGPDRRVLTARRDGMGFAASTAAELEHLMTVAEAWRGWSRRE